MTDESDDLEEMRLHLGHLGHEIREFFRRWSHKCGGEDPAAEELFHGWLEEIKGIEEGLYRE